MNIIDLILHVDIYLESIIGSYGLLVYLLMFLIVFIETGLVVTPFLPGDSLIFAAAALSARGMLNFYFVVILFSVAAILGDSMNYFIGKFFGHRLIQSKRVNKKYLLDAQEFFRRHGAKTIFLGRFIPIIRTFAPFVAGLGKMDYQKFIFYNILGGIVWVVFFSLLGLFFGNLPFVKNNFSFVVGAIIILSLLPILIEYLRKKH